MSNRLDQLELIVASNSRAIAALANQVSEMGQSLETSIENLTEAINQGMKTQGQRLETNIENLTEAVNQGMVAQDQRQAETDRQLQILIEESRDSRARLTKNAEEHADFRQELKAVTESIQALLSSFTNEIRAIWQQLSA
jgi:chromosome segregation ATPase